MTDYPISVSYERVALLIKLLREQNVIVLWKIRELKQLLTSLSMRRHSDIPLRSNLNQRIRGINLILNKLNVLVAAMSGLISVVTDDFAFIETLTVIQHRKWVILARRALKAYHILLVRTHFI